MKLVRFKGGPEMVNLYGKDVEVQECMVADQTAMVKLVVWDRDIAAVSEDKCYMFSNLSTRESNGVYLTTTRSSTIEEVDSFDVPADITS